jgi:antitoxin PrlF
MTIAKSRLTAQGQISVPAEIRRLLGLAPGSVLEWVQVEDAVVVRRAARFNSEDLHRALFSSSGPPPRLSLDELRAAGRRPVKPRREGD